MLKRNQAPYLAHVFVCTNDRGGARKSCADSDSPRLKAALKELVNEQGWQGRVRVSTAGCLGLCAQGPNVLIYPQQIWFAEVSLADLDEIMATLEQLVAGR